MATQRPPNAPQQPRPQPQPPKPHPRSLRIGIILGGKIVEERLIRKRRTITIGQSVKNEFSVPIEALPRTWPLFVEKNGHYYLHFTNAMDGRISDGGQVHPLASLKGRTAQPVGNAWYLPLAESSRGKIVLGDMTLLFQFVSAPPLQPRPHLPASLRGTIVDRIEPQLALILAISLALHAGIFVYARWIHDETTGRSRAERVYKATFEAPRTADVDFTTEAITDGEDGKAEKESEAKEEKPGKKGDGKKSGGGQDKGSGGGDEGPSDEELAARAEFEVSQMFSEDETEEGTAGGMGDRKPADDLAGEIESVKESGGSVAIARGDNSRGPRRTDAGRARTGGPDVRVSGTEAGSTTAAVKGPKIKKPKVVIKTPLSDDEAASLTPSAVMRKIRTQYAYGLRQCFKRILKADPTASGTIRLKFQVGERGNVTRAKVDGFGYPELDQCVQAKVMKWRFAKPLDEDGEATAVTFKVSLPFSGE